VLFDLFFSMPAPCHKAVFPAPLRGTLSLAGPTPDGRLYASSSDAVIRSLPLSGFPMGEAVDVRDVAEPVVGIASSPDGKSLAYWTEDHSVRVFDPQTDAPAKLISRCAKSVRHAAFDPNHLYLAIASDESIVRIVNVHAIEESWTLKGYEGPVMAVAWDASGQRLATAGSDGSLGVWASDGKLLKAIPGAIARPFLRDEGRFSLVFVPSGDTERLVFPAEAGLNQLDDGFQIQPLLQSQSLKHPRLFAVSADLRHVCVADGGRNFVLAALCGASLAVVLRTFQHNSHLMAIFWNPGGPFGYADETGAVGLWRDANPAEPEPKATPIAVVPDSAEDDAPLPRKGARKPVVAEPETQQTPHTSQPKEKPKAKKSEPQTSETPTATNGQQEIPEATASRFIDQAEEADDEEEEDEAMDEDLDEEERAMVNTVRKSGYQAADIPQGIVDEDDGAPAAPVRRELTPEVAEEVAEDEEEEGSEAEEADQHLAPRELLQEAFQPTSIPDVGETGISTLACNAYGTITLHETADGPPAVVITPADQAKYKPARIAGHYVKLAALGKTGAALGCCPPEGVTGSSNSYVMFKALDTWASNSSWSLHFAAHEDILGLGINSKYVAVFTSRFMRVFTASGIESAVLSFPHRFVACAGCEKALLAVACDDGGTELKVSVFDLQARTAVHSLLPVALTPRTHMMWLGWSDDAVLSTCDTAGVVRCLHSDFGAQWVPMYDPLTRPDQARYWPTGLDRQRLYGIPCKPGTNHPAPTADLTVPQSVDLQIPLTPTDRMEYRERYLRTLYKAEELKRHATVYTPEIQDADKEMDRCSFTLFEAALERDQTQRAFDHAACFNLRSTYETAMKRAHAKGHTALLRGMTEVLQRRFSKLRRLCPLPDPGQKERQRELQDRKLQEKIQKLVPVPVAAPAPVPPPAPNGLPDPDETQLLESELTTDAAAPFGVAKQLFAASQHGAHEASTPQSLPKAPALDRRGSSLGDSQSSQKEGGKRKGIPSPAVPPNTPPRPTESPFAAFSPGSKLQSTPSTMDAALSSLSAAISQPKPSQRFSGPSPTARPAHGQTRGSLTPTGPPTTPSPSPFPAGKGVSAEARLTAARFVRNPSHTYPAPSPATPCLSLEGDTPQREKAVTPAVSSELGRAALSALRKRQCDEDTEDPVEDIPVVKAARVA